MTQLTAVEELAERDSQGETTVSFLTTAQRYRLIVHTIQWAMTTAADPNAERHLAEALHDLLGRPDLSGAKR